MTLTKTRKSLVINLGRNSELRWLDTKHAGVPFSDPSRVLSLIEPSPASYIRSGNTTPTMLVRNVKGASHVYAATRLIVEVPHSALAVGAFVARVLIVAFLRSFMHEVQRLEALGTRHITLSVRSEPCQDANLL
jgi:hypothetical protein